MTKGMIVRKAFDAAWVAMGWDNQNPQATEAQERFVAAYEAAKLAALPADKVERVALAIAEYVAADEEVDFDSLCDRTALAALAALPPVQEVSERDAERIIRLAIECHNEPTEQAHEVVVTFQTLGYRIIKGGM